MRSLPVAEQVSVSVITGVLGEMDTVPMVGEVFWTVAVAIEESLKKSGGIWFGWSGEVSKEKEIEPTILTENNIKYVTLSLSTENYENFYNGYSNASLWPLLHYRLDLVEYSRKKYLGYKKVNEIQKYYSTINNDENYEKSLSILADAKKEVFEFFDNVKVNEENETLRKNRLELINMLCKTFQNFTNFQMLKTSNE